MGIWKQKGDPAPREAVVLINDPSFARSFGQCGDEPVPRIAWAGDLFAEVQLERGCRAPEAGAEAVIMCARDEPATVWVSDPIPRCVGQLVEPGADVVAAFIRSAHSGVGAVVSSPDSVARAGRLRVRIPGVGPQV